METNYKRLTEELVYNTISSGNVNVSHGKFLAKY